MDERFQCPKCGWKMSFHQKLKALSTFDHKGNEISLEIVWESRKVRCGKCDYEAEEKRFRVGEAEE